MPRQLCTHLRKIMRDALVSERTTSAVDHLTIRWCNAATVRAAVQLKVRLELPQMCTQLVGPLSLKT
jgi:hypothetical protein